MRKIHSRLTLLLCGLVIVTAVFSLLLSLLARGGLWYQQDFDRFTPLGSAIRDGLIVVLLLTAIAALITMVTRSTTKPIRDLNRAAQEIAGGNFNISVSLRDNVEEFGELEKSFNLMVSELRSNEYLRKDFISNVSHELKTPLSILNGYAALLAEPGLPEADRVEYARYVTEESDRLVRLIDDMLRLSRIEYRQIAPQAECFDLSEQLRQSILQQQPRSEQNKLTLSADIAEVMISGDRDLLRQVWSNLLDNAVKFSRPGGSVAVSLVRDGDSAVVSVSDTGIGMDDYTLSRIFEQFYQGESDHKREGSGLGLPLARRIVELHRGTMEVESAVGEGSRFTVTLPLS